MLDFLSFKETLFAQLNHSNEIDVFKYLDTLNQHSDFSKLEQYSSKLNQLDDLEWLNVKEKPKWCELKGKLILIDFWTYCCINCMHIIPLLNQLENEFTQLCVIGVHSSKFTNEKSMINIYNAMRRHLIKHPVVCDSDLTIWSDMQIMCWPTLLVINPHGVVIAEFIGETQANLVKDFLGICFKYYENQLYNNLNLIQHHMSFDQIDYTTNKISFPTKLCIDSIRSILFISDSGNNRILGIEAENEIKYVIGNGKIGLVNSSLKESEFNWPQGITLDSETNCLYVCDTFNNVIRCADLNSNQVSTICGVPHVSENNLGYYDLTGGRLATEQPISSPWDLCLLNRENTKILLIACAGTHQIWLYSFENKLLTHKLNDFNGIVWWRGLKFEWNTLVCVAGNGKERNKNNSYPLQASFAQPSGIEYDSTNECVYLADAESSTVRSVSLKDGCVKGIVGGDQFQPDDLFAYGDKDGKGSEVRLQHPLDVKYLKQNEKEVLLVVDSYNHALKLVDLKTKVCQKLTLTSGSLNEPNGVCIDTANSLVYICDTNNHTIKRIRNFDSNKLEYELEELKLNSLLTHKLIENLSINSSREIHFELINKNFELNLEANNTWKLVIKFKNGTKAEHSGNIVRESKLESNLFKLTSDDSFRLEEIKKIELNFCLYYCEQNSSELSSKVCKLAKKCFKYTCDELSKKTKNAESAIVLEVKI